ncbi:putative lipid II flippase FtsW [Rhodococcus sp. ABRD24]|uniref:putative lipid II flippase FtsW n=1 Tax=Rhodococcus sp. ABRD24 TaxID=2507582 RepID=UPI001F6084CD|nr:putative lipid II flippase FtsW [Rhodococcus sp. ABRD24]
MPISTGAVRTVPAAPGMRLEVWMSRPLFDFHLILGVTALLVAIGLTMVLSSSSVVSFVSSGSPYARFIPQCIYAALGVIVFIAIVRVRTSTIRAAAPWLLGLSLAMLVLVLIPGIGVEQMGARSWFVIGPLSFQPSELAKVALVVWCAHLIAAHASSRGGVGTALKPLAVIGVLVLALVVLQRDLGTMITIGTILMAVLWFGKFQAPYVAAITLTGIVVSVILGLTAGYRSDRIKAFMNPDLDPLGLNYQSTQAKYALANGGLFGKGLGQSDAKWSYLPQSHNDFIFAVIGEELGLIGAGMILALFGIVLLVGLRIADRSADPFLRMLSATATTWIVLQAFINVAYVVGLIPVTGLQLPLISAGGTSMLTTMMMFGVIAHVALREPEALSSLSSGGSSWLTRVFGSPAVESPPTARSRDRTVPTRRQKSAQAQDREPRRREPSDPGRPAYDPGVAARRQRRSQR